MVIFNILFIVHLLVDFFFRNDLSVERKENERLKSKKFHKSEILKHSLLYIVLSSVIFIVAFSQEYSDYLIVLLAFCTHGVIDLIKVLLKRKYKYHDKLLFSLDQMVHVLVLIAISLFISNSFKIVDTPFLTQKDSFYILIIILLTRPANIIFGVLFSSFKPLNDNDEKGFENAGGMIGALERLIVFALLVTNNFSSIGFVIAAKSLARFKEFEDRRFGEYFLLGTLYSLLYTLIVYYAFLVRI